MENGHLHDDKLFRAVHDRLSDYEVPYNGTDWDAMSRSLDQLPKTSRFQWKFSLNTLFAGLAVVGLSLLGYALANNSGKPANPNLMATPVMQAAMQSKPEVKQTVTNPLATVPAPAAATLTDPGMEQQLLTNNQVATEGNDTHRKKTDKNDKNGFLFGDQIDRRKGFIYQTSEDQSLVNSFQPKQSPYYTVDNGVIKQVDFKKDSTGLKGEKKDIPQADSVQTNSGGGAPTDGDQHGFDFEGNR